MLELQPKISTGSFLGGCFNLDLHNNNIWSMNLCISFLYFAVRSGCDVK
jgi:hypothetical protein